MSRMKIYDIVVAGTGPAGLATALLAEYAGLDVALIGPRENADDGRTTTLMLPALRILEHAGIDSRFGGRAAALKTMRIIDGTKRLIRSPVSTFEAFEIGETHFGMNIPNRVLNATLAGNVRATGVRWRETIVSGWTLKADHNLAALEDGATVRAKLVAAADGRNSPARAAAGLSVRLSAHGQAAFVTTFSHERAHNGVSTEFHTEYGPFTAVPLPGNRSSLVWVTKPHRAEELLATPADELSFRIENRMESVLGKVTVDGGLQVYPLSSGLPSAFAAKRIALVGEAAHVFPPIGAQGLNLGIRDAADLIAVAESNRADPGSDSAMRMYEGKRRPDIVARTGAVSLLNRSLLSDSPPAQIARSLGLAALSGFAPLRGFFMREGMYPGSGVSAFLSSIREQVGRQRAGGDRI